MRIFLLGALLSATACSPASTKTEAVANPQHTAVESYLRKTLDDPASYQPAHWSKPEQLTRLDSARIVALALFATNNEDDTDQGLALVKSVGADSLKPAGSTFIHAFRAKNKMGATVLDSARFIVSPAGKVAVLP
jgi:hypothetical protein